MYIHTPCLILISFLVVVGGMCIAQHLHLIIKFSLGAKTLYHLTKLIEASLALIECEFVLLGLGHIHDLGVCSICCWCSCGWDLIYTATRPMMIVAASLIQMRVVVIVVVHYINGVACF